MTKIFVQYKDETKEEIVAVFSCKQGDECKNQGLEDTESKIYKIYKKAVNDALPSSVNVLP